MGRLVKFLIVSATTVFALALIGCSDVDSEPTSGNATQETDSAGSDSGSGSKTETKGKIILHAQYPYIYIWESGMSRFDNKQSEMDAEGNGWYRFEIESSSAMVIFKPNADDWNGQTDDLHATTGEWWYDGSELSESKPSGGQADTKLSAPTWVIATAASSSSIELSWNSVSGATEYLVYKSEYSSYSYASLVGSTALTSKTVTGLEADTTYYFWIKAANSTTTSDYSPYDYATTKAASSGSGGSSSGTTTTLSAPTGLTATTKSSSEITLSWNAVSGATLYYVYYGTNSSSTSARLYTSSAATRCTVSSLSASTLYYFLVKACASDGTESDFSNFANARTNANSSGSGGTITTTDTATIYFVGSSSAISATGFNNIYVGNYQFGDLFTSVKTSKTLSAGTVDGPYQIEAGTYLLKFGNPATGKVYNSTAVRRTAIKDKNGHIKGYSLSTYDLSDYKFEFEEGKVYTISKTSGTSSAKSTSGRTVSVTYHNIKAKEGTD